MEGQASRLAEEARVWLLSSAMPIWGSRGRTSAGLFAERMTRDGVPDDSYFRTFVQARHVYATIVAGELGWSGPWRDLVAQTMNTLLDHARRPDGFFVHRLDRDARVIDARADLYDQAFVLFALGHAGAALDNPHLYDMAEQLLDVIEARWGHPSGGFREGEIVEPSIRRQNPHMHLLEAFIALYNASGRRRFAAAAQAVAELCRTRFVDPASGGLLEYFTQEWSPAAGADGYIVEPGHCFEWAWLFEQLMENPEGNYAVSDRLTAFGRRYGIDAWHGVAINAVLTDGNVMNAQARLWPQTERLKIAAARFQRKGRETDLHEMADAWKAIQRYLLPEEPGLWHDVMQENGTFRQEMVPGSVLYHIACAIREMCRLPVARNGVFLPG